MATKIIAVCVAAVFMACGVGSTAITQNAGPATGGAKPAGTFMQNNPQLQQEFQNLPKWKREAIRRIIHRAHKEIKAVRENTSLTREQKAERIRHIVKKMREQIRRIINATGGGAATAGGVHTGATAPAGAGATGGPAK